MSKNVNIIEVAKKAGVSKSTVSRALNNDYGISSTAKEKVLKAVEELKYRPNISARYLRQNKNDLLGILISREHGDESIAHLVNSRKISGIVKKSKDLGFDVLIFIEDISDHNRLYNIIKEKGIAGIILLDIVPEEILEGFRNYNIPFVLVNWFVPGYIHQCYVKTDLEKATLMALDLLLSKGYTEIAVVNWEDSKMGESVIENTFVKYMRDKGLNYKDCVWNTYIEVEKEKVVNFLEGTKKRAYLSFCYFTSIKIIEYCREKNISIPEDLALISYEFFPFFDYLHPSLTGIRQPAEAMGEKAVEKLVKKIKGDITVTNELIEPELVLRNSC